MVTGFISTRAELSLELTAFIPTRAEWSLVRIDSFHPRIDSIDPEKIKMNLVI